MELNRIYLGDAFDLINLIPDNSVDLFFFDPPFNLNKDYGKNIKDKFSKEVYLNSQYELLKVCISKLKDTGCIVYHTIPKWAFKIANFLDEAGMIFHSWICWSSTGGFPIPNRIQAKHYPILWFSKTKNKTFNKIYRNIDRCKKCNEPKVNYGGKYKNLKEINGEKVIVLTDVWDDIARIRNGKSKNRVANELPEKLMERIIFSFSNENDLIVDCFTGSGTTLKVAKELNRNFIGFEMNEDSYNIAYNRIK